MTRKIAVVAAATLALAAALVWWSTTATLSDRRAEDLVREYNRCVIEAYRQGDPIRVEAVTSPAEGKKLAGLIGAKSDMGLTMDAQLVDLQITRIVREDLGVQVETAERWHYADRRIGDGAVQGAPSDDNYAMRYYLKKSGDRWLVDHIAFAADPVVGRAASLALQPPAINHGKGTTTAPAQPEAKP